MQGLIILGISNLYLFLPILSVILNVNFRGGIEYANTTFIYISLGVIGVTSLLSFILLVIDYIANNGSSSSYSSYRSSSYKNYNNNNNNQNSDYRSKASGPYYNVLNDKCRSIAREFSRLNELNHGRATLDINVRINNNNISYIININVSSNARDQYEVNDLQSSLKRKLEDISESIYNRTSYELDKLRNKFQDFDDEYNINVKVGSVR